MRTLINRLRRLEDRRRPQVDEKGRTLVDILRERQRKWRAKEGLPPEDEAEEVLYDPDDPPRSLADVLNYGRDHARAANSK